MPNPIKLYYDNGNIRYEQWFENDKFHRIDGPAVTYYYENGNVESEAWWTNNELHRIYDPAVIWYHKNGNLSKEEWYENGIKLTDKEITVLKRKLKLCQIQ